MAVGSQPVEVTTNLVNVARNLLDKRLILLGSTD